VLEHLHDAGTGLRPGVSLVDAGTDLLNHIESFAEYDRVVLLDAILDSEGQMGAPGAVAVLEEKSFLSWSEKSESAHQVSPVLGIKLFRTLNPAAKTRIYLVGFFVDRISPQPFYMTDERIEEAVAAALRVLETQ
jgi:hydrogenase maturation protease